MAFGLVGVARARNSDELIYPAFAAGVSTWAPSSVPVPITPLEFDIQAVSFVDGFGQALSAIVGHPIRAAVRSRRGALYSAMTTPGNESRAAADGRWTMPDLGCAWRHSVRPEALRHERFFTTADATQTADIAGILREVVTRMTSLTYQHHTLVLPARLVIAEFCGYAITEGVVSAQLDALTLLAGLANATTRMASEVWEYRTRPALLPPLAQEGDGYGIAHPGWLESRQAPGLLAGLYRNCPSDRDPRALLARTSRRRLRGWQAARSTVTRLPVAVRERFTRAHERARGAAWLTEGHAPLMHVRITHAMRRLVYRLDRRLVDLDLIEQPDDVMYLRIHEIDQLDRARAWDRVAQRRAECALFAATSTATGPTPAVRDPLGESAIARRIREVFSSVADTDAGPSGIVGYPGAPGQARGRCRRVVRQADLSKIEPGDVVVAADSAAVWSYTAPAASAFVAATGSVFGHLASLARDYGVPCVVGTGPMHGVTDGNWTEVDGDTGIIKAESEQP